MEKQVKQLAQVKWESSRHVINSVPFKMFLFDTVTH